MKHVRNTSYVTRAERLQAIRIRLVTQLSLDAGAGAGAGEARAAGEAEPAADSQRFETTNYRNNKNPAGEIERAKKHINANV